MSLCWLCPGQGSQTPELLARLADDTSLARALAPLRDTLPAATLEAADDPQHCFDNRHAQPLIVLHACTVAAALADAGVRPAVVAGYSVGELSAHAVAGALAPETAIALAVERAAAMDAAAPPDSGMSAVRGVPLARLREQCEAAGCAVAIVNAADHAVLAGPRAALEQLGAQLTAGGAHVVPLDIGVPAHAHWLAAAVAPFARALDAADWQAHAVPVPRGLDGRLVRSRAAAVEALSRALAEPLDWARTLDVAREMGATIFFELGPGDGLARMARERFPDLAVRALADFASLEGAAKWLARERNR
ncbi:acyltransferase domain-containing protein [Pseudazoarcus pumilus]|uniref:Malonate decarboxylase subunit epsilon n=1 Tax=Pseudazoarcus pumilus TaxID=2067960 RepID=A0A2I6S802_9RHOO|nr:acyltransferase domain-containing protein [Pseudazoarcus pumilus]AUN95372.1 malonate decarboxylase subunit epsilon [Pseudazoarcus pumilus]